METTTRGGARFSCSALAAALVAAGLGGCGDDPEGFEIFFPDTVREDAGAADADAPEPDAEVGPDGGPDAPDAVPDVVPDVTPEASEDDGGEPPPLGLLDDLRLYVNLGDSLAAGYNAAGRNGASGHGYARLVLENHADYPAYLAHHLRALFPTVQFVDLGDSGATTSDTLGNLRDALGGSLPRSVDGDVLVSLTCGGNDFNDDVMTMVLASATDAAAARLQTNYREIFRLLRERYEDPAAGKAVVFLVTNVHDPTGGTGAIPAGFDEGFCGTLNDPRLAIARAAAIANLGRFNDAIAAVTAELGARLVDNHGVFLDHGMNAPGAERWIDDDCVHPTNEGHHQLRREEWFVLAGERW
ncbi:MAG: SGNH/GDSL hydrolase family protein [Deltaproteobacteria bacterium]|nr:SGNH/GDSL hydrolase family protein [Deltaproteobacteria bacterium]